ncbi:FtsX-like permease family protein [Allorhodopirellula solitaria]|uniref:FtsX-like permease family protein n=2 Tax=Allorhodopirellula solitaria TaxID=2527987 RepID=A0A5C5XWU0_9BACT|nr:FtsX-like permease family protein [Allorhodopirellula solitaria]
MVPHSPENSPATPAKRTRLAWQNLADTPVRTMVSLGGIGFAILLMFMQLGFLGSVGDTATVVYSRMQGDLLVRSKEYLHVYDTASLPDELPGWLAGLPEVSRTIPLDIGVTQWQNPSDHSFRAIALMGVDLDNPAFDLPELSPSMRAALRSTGAVLIDDASASDFGPRQGDHFTEADVGVTTDVAGSNATLKGTFAMGTGLAANGALLASRETFAALTPGGHNDRVSLVLIELADSLSADAGLDAVRRRLRSLGGPAAHADAITLDQAKIAEQQMWYTQTPIGMIFGIGVALAVLVGGVIGYMVLAADVTAHLSEYATLKAMGYSNRFLVKTLLSQSSLLALLAFPVALLASLILYSISSAVSGILIEMTWARIALVFALSLVMCNAAGILALRKLLKAEPANLF